MKVGKIPKFKFSGCYGLRKPMAKQLRQLNKTRTIGTKNDTKSPILNKSAKQKSEKMLVEIVCHVTSYEKLYNFQFESEKNILHVNDNGQESCQYVFDSIINENLSSSVDEMGHLFGSERYNTLFITSFGKSFISNQTNYLKAITERFFQSKYKEIYFSYCFTIDDQLFDLLESNNSNIRLKLNDGNLSYSQRKISSFEHLLDLVELGNSRNIMKQHFKDENRNFRIIFLYDIYTLDGKDEKNFIITECCLNTESKNTDILQSINKVEGCIRARKRKQNLIPIETCPLTQYLEPAIINEKSSFKFLIVIPPERSISFEIILLLNSFQRMRNYGSENDDYGETIIEKNRALIEALHESYKTDLYLHLLNNVSILEGDMLEMHDHFNKTMLNRCSQFQLLRKISSNDREYALDKYANQLLNLLVDQRKQINDLINSVQKFRIGLDQLRQSVDDTTTTKSIALE
ncbi:Kinesin-like protein kif2a [Blomia tropicalis]|nr:Kinesin-like protein kif2a [Blomia tropicalis]